MAAKKTPAKKKAPAKKAPAKKPDIDRDAIVEGNGGRFRGQDKPHKACRQLRRYLACALSEERIQVTAVGSVDYRLW